MVALTTAILGGAAIAGVTGLLSSRSASKEARKGTEAAAEASVEATEKQIASTERIYAQGRADLAPYRDVGRIALGDLTSKIEEYEADPLVLEEYGLADLELDPGYQFRLSEGEKALERAAVSRGMSRSGRGLKDVGRYVQRFASDEYGRAYARYIDRFQSRVANREREYARVAGLADIGQAAAAGTASLGAGAASNIAAAYGQQGAGLASLYSNLGGTQANLALQGGSAVNTAIQGGIGNLVALQQMEQQAAQQKALTDALGRFTGA